MQYDFSTSRMAGVIGDRLTAWNNPGITAGDMKKIRPMAQYNVLMTAFNASSGLLVMAAVLPVFWGFSAAVTVGAAGLFLRNVTEKALNKIADPTGGHATVQERADNIFKFIAPPDMPPSYGMPRGWEENNGVFLGHVFLKNPAPVPALIGSQQ